MERESPLPFASTMPSAYSQLLPDISAPGGGERKALKAIVRNHELGQAFATREAGVRVHTCCHFIMLCSSPEDPSGSNAAYQAVQMARLHSRVSVKRLYFHPSCKSTVRPCGLCTRGKNSDNIYSSCVVLHHVHLSPVQWVY